MQKIELSPEDLEQWRSTAFNPKLTLQELLRAQQARSFLMFNRFSDRAREVLRLANEWAASYQHDYIGSEHILYGLCTVNVGVIVDFFRSANLDPQQIISDLQKVVVVGVEGDEGELLPFPGKRPYTTRAKALIYNADEVSRSLKCGFIGAEHLLLGALRDTECIAAQVLKNLGLTYKTASKILVGTPPDQTLPANESEKLDLSCLRRHLKGVGLELAKLNQYLSEQQQQSLGSLHWQARLADAVLCQGGSLAQGVRPEVTDKLQELIEEGVLVLSCSRHSIALMNAQTGQRIVGLNEAWDILQSLQQTETNPPSGETKPPSGETNDHASA